MTSRDENRQLAEAHAEVMRIHADDTQFQDERTHEPDGFTHNDDACQDLPYALCDAYGDGYSKAYFVVRTGTRSSMRPLVDATPVWPRDLGGKVTL